MPIYRVIRALKLGNQIINGGSISSLTSVSQASIKSLLDLGRITLVSGPPMSALPGWGFKAKKLESVGLALSTDFLDAPEDQLAVLFKVTFTMVKRWKKEVEEWLTVDGPKPRKS